MEERILSLEQQLTFNVEVLYSLQRHVRRAPDMSQAEFRGIAADILMRHPNIQALEWIPRVPHEERTAFETSRRADYPDFEIREQDATEAMVPATVRPEYYPVSYVEPHEGNERAVGFDLASISIRRASLVAAAETGDLRISGVVGLV